LKEVLQESANVGCLRGKTPLDPDEFGFAYSNPIETSFKQRCFEELKLYHRRLLITLRNEGPGILGDASEYDVRRVVERLKKTSCRAKEECC
jgi:hypothetical protein